MEQRDLAKAALRGEPSYIWRAGQQRRLEMILQSAGERIRGRVLDNGCGVGMYVERMAPFGGWVVGLEYDFARAAQAGTRSPRIINSVGELLPFADGTFDLVLSHEVLEHVQDDTQAVREIIRVLKPGGRAVVFVPNRGYPFETHGIYWRGRYRFGNIALVNYLPRRWREHLAPHVRVYSRGDLNKLFSGLPAVVVSQRVIFGAYDNLIARFGVIGRFLRGLFQAMEKTPLRGLGLSHLWVVEKSA